MADLSMTAKQVRVCALYNLSGLVCGALASQLEPIAHSDAVACAAEFAPLRGNTLNL